MKGYINISNALISAQADVNAKDGPGWTPLTLSAVNGHDDIASVLRDAGAREADE